MGFVCVGQMNCLFRFSVFFKLGSGNIVEMTGRWIFLFFFLFARLMKTIYAQVFVEKLVSNFYWSEIK